MAVYFFKLFVLLSVLEWPWFEASMNLNCSENDRTYMKVLVSKGQFYQCNDKNVFFYTYFLSSKFLKNVDVNKNVCFAKQDLFVK